ncbi:hypothetical protein [Dinoroseobacter sp. S124A]|uniref:hypothetical protein n=1 Tax=Dinoroseobacter sp. S124A TaxID=3415128 RepID=UPI003C7B9CFA
MKFLSLISCLFCVAMAGAAHATPITLTGLAIGDPNPPLSTADEFQNGDFTIRQIGGLSSASLINDATEETTGWSYDLTAQLADRMVVEVTSAKLTLDVRTGGDTPANDPFRLDGFEIANPFNGPANFDSFTTTLDLLDLFGEDRLLRSINNDGLLKFGLGNDSTVSRGALSISVVVPPIPLPASAGLLLGALALIGGARIARRKASAMRLAPTSRLP